MTPAVLATKQISGIFSGTQEKLGLPQIPTPCGVKYCYLYMYDISVELGSEILRANFSYVGGLPKKLFYIARYFSAVFLFFGKKKFHFTCPAPLR